MTTSDLPPLSLYIHMPWCIRKCPYCDFNSHAVSGEIPERQYITALLEDFFQSERYIYDRPLQSIFFGGGTPSLFSAASLEQLLNGIAQRVSFVDGIEITLEANPGTLEAKRFVDYRTIGINRLSIGVQSFDDAQLKKLGRIHDATAAHRAIESAIQSGFTNFNLDLMYGLPDQTVEQAIKDLEAALTWTPPHLSWYQLTIEPNTFFYKHPPHIPDDPIIADMDEAGRRELTAGGLTRYEISAYSQPGRESRHNLNYWLFGDYLGIGAGAHGKLSAPGGPFRTQKMRQPSDYLDQRKAFLAKHTDVSLADLPLEFMLNATRLTQPISYELFQARTTLSSSSLFPMLEIAADRGLVTLSPTGFQVTPKGHQYLNDLQALFLY